MSFWQDKTLAELSDSEWEALCDGCGRCCLQKFEDDQSGQVRYSQVACKLLNLNTCRCQQYAQRREKVADCLDLKNNLQALNWLPQTCAYRLRHQGMPLPQWHPLISGRADSVQHAGISVSSYAMPPHRSLNAKHHLLPFI